MNTSIRYILMQFVMLCIGLFLCICIPCAAQEKADTADQDESTETTPQEVIEKFIEALGGEMTLSSFESLRMKRTFEGDTAGSGELLYWNRRKLASADYNGYPEFKLFDGQHWWSLHQNSDTSEYTKVSEYYDEGLFESPTDAFRLLELANEMDVVPKTEYQDGPFAHCVCLRRQMADSYTLRFFDPDTGLLVRVQMKKSRNDDFDFFNDIEYTQFHDLKFVSVVKRSNSGSWKCQVTLSNFEIDPELDKALFSATTDDD